MKKLILILSALLMALLILSGCAGAGAGDATSEPEITAEPTTEATTDPNEPVSSDDPTTEPTEPVIAGDQVEGVAPVERVDVLIMESFPVQVSASVAGYLPDGCTTLAEPRVSFDGANTFTVVLPTTRPADAMCTEAIVDFDTSIPLPVEGLPKGIYTVDVNGVTATFELAVDNTAGIDPSAGCTDAGDDSELHNDAEAGYCFLYTSGFEVDQPAEGVTSIIGPALDDSIEPVRATLYISVQDAQGKTTEEWVGENLAAVTGIEITQSSITLGGEEAIVLDGMPGQATNRQIFIVHGDKLYVLVFSPFAEDYGEEAFTQVQALYNTVTSTWAWLSAE
jgi:inhibitor of cysteine peptidase